MVSAWCLSGKKCGVERLGAGAASWVLKTEVIGEYLRRRRKGSKSCQPDGGGEKHGRMKDLSAGELWRMEALA